MANKLHPITDPGQPIDYQIRIKGHLSDHWTDWFEGMTITLEDGGDTLLTGRVVDQAALFGLLKKVRDLGLQLVSINCVQPEARCVRGQTLRIINIDRKGEMR